MRSMLAVFSFLVGVSMSGPALADRILTCFFPPSGTAGDAVGEVLVHHVSGEAEATVISTATIAFKAGKVKGRVIKDDPKIFIVSWQVKAKNGSNQYATLKYTLKVRADGSKSDLRAQPVGYDNEWNNRGTCNPFKG